MTTPPPPQEQNPASPEPWRNDAPASPVSASPHPSSAVPVSSTTGSYPVISSLPAHTSPASAPPPPVVPPKQSAGAAPTWFVVSAVVALLVVAAAQTAMLFVVSANVSEQKRRNADLQGAVSELEEAVSTYNDRILKVEGRTAGILNAAQVAADVLPAVFLIDVKDGTGSGFAIGQEPPEGGTYIITNHHVVASHVQRDEPVTLVQGEKKYEATVVDSDKRRDIAILHTEENFPRLRAASKVVASGDPVVVVGAPLGLSDTVTTGVVSAVREERGQTYVQFDAAISPGNSGGPVVNADGEVVGIATAKIAHESVTGIGFAVPIDEACSLDVRC